MKRFIFGLAAFAILGFANQADASGFALIEQSVTSMGCAYAGAAAVAQDASTIWFNPAGMTCIQCSDLVAGIHGVFPTAKFHNDDSQLSPGVAQIAQFFGEPTELSGGNGGDFGISAPVGHSFYVLPGRYCGCDNIWFGLGLNAPFGLVTDYDGDWVGRYHADRSRLFSLNINPCVAVKLTNCLSLGIGYNWMYINAKLTNAVDFGSIYSAVAITQGLSTAGVRPQLNDGKAVLTGNSWGYGGDIGLLWDNCCGTRIGLAYRTEVRHHLSGDIKYKRNFVDVNPTFNLFISEAFPNSDAVADITLPSSLSLSVYQRLNNCLAILGDITWWKWKVLKRLKVRFKDQPQGVVFDPATSDSITTLKWENCFRYSLGFEYYLNQCFTYRAGVAYDETPTPNEHFRTARVPDEDRVWLATGFSYKLYNCIYFDFGYAYLFVRKANIDTNVNLGPGEENFFKGQLRGHYDAYTNIVSAQIDVRF